MAVCVTGASPGVRGDSHFGTKRYTPPVVFLKRTQKTVNKKGSTEAILEGAQATENEKVKRGCPFSFYSLLLIGSYYANIVIYPAIVL
jgi:hypothetical protein